MITKKCKNDCLVRVRSAMAFMDKAFKILKTFEKLMEVLGTLRSSPSKLVFPSVTCDQLLFIEYNA